MRILISTRYLGGSGGIERHVASTIECLGERHEIDVCATHAVATGYAVAPDRARVLPHEQWDRPSRRKHPVAGTRSVARDWRRRRGALYDAYLHYQHAEHVQRRFPVGVRMVIPCGDDVRSIEDRFDAVLLEAPDNERFVEDKSKAVLFPPPLNVPAARSVAVDGLPAEFFLTIFNPHHPRKGQANMQAVAPRSPIPIVWCRSSQSPYPAERAAAEFDGIVVLEDRTQEELRFLYERCRAYISFDHNQASAGRSPTHCSTACRRCRAGEG